ncbi:MAG: glucokinase [Burkholderiales bacterium]|jgi:glucokinase
MFESRDHTQAMPAAHPRWLGDIGGTNARFGWQETEDGPITDVHVLPCADYASLQEAAMAYLALAHKDVPLSAAFGIANPVMGDAVAMTNHHWRFSVNELRLKLNLHRLLLLNDFTALALSLTTLPVANKHQVGGGQAAPDAAIGLIGPGTGLGVSGLLPLGHQNKWIPIAGEGGHVTLSATNDDEYALIKHLQQRYGHVSGERVISGTGLVDLYHALGDLHGGAARDIVTAADVLERASLEPASRANQAIDLFCAFLGSAAGDLALTLGARGGIYIGGGIVPRLGKRFNESPFRARFENKGRFKGYLEQVPTWVINSPVSPALMGASKALSLAIW